MVCFLDCLDCLDNILQIGGFNNNSLTVLEDRSLRLSCWQCWFFQGLSPWLIDACLFAVSSHGLCSVNAERAPISLLLLIMTPVVLGQGLTLTLIVSLKVLSPNTVTLRARASASECSFHNSGYKGDPIPFIKLKSDHTGENTAWEETRLDFWILA